MSDYLLGAADDELARLGFQHEVWAQPTAWLWDEAHFRRGQRLLDLGSGPGFASTSLARRVGPEGSVLAVDSSEKSVALLKDRASGLAQLEAQVADVASLELEDASLDGVFARWLFCFLPNAKEAAIRVARWLRPGGTVAILDYYHYDGFSIAPPAPVMPRLVDAVKRSWRDSGGDLNVAGHLPTWLQEAGLRLRAVRPFVHCARPGTPLWNWPLTFFATYLDVLVSREYLSADDADAFRAAVAERANNPGAFLMTPPVLGIVAEKP
ncbi:MAG: methyltransferase domain-containing protein [Myxococcota bacterium]